MKLEKWHQTEHIWNTSFSNLIIIYLLISSFEKYVTWYLIIALHTDAEKFDVHYFIQHRKDQVYWRGWICCFCATLLLQILVFTREFLGFRPCYFYLCFVYLLFVSSLFVWTQTQRIFEGTYIHHSFDVFTSYIWIMYTFVRDSALQKREVKTTFCNSLFTIEKLPKERT